MIRSIMQILLMPFSGSALDEAVDHAQRLDRPRRLQRAVPRVDALNLHGVAGASRRLDAEVLGLEHPVDVHGAVEPVGVIRVLERGYELAALDPDRAVGHHPVDLDPFEGVDEDDVGEAPRRDHAHVVVHPVELGRLDGGHLDRGHRSMPFCTATRMALSIWPRSSIQSGVITSVQSWKARA